MKKVNSAAEYLVWLIKKYHEIKTTYADASYRVIDIENPNSDKTTLIIQVCGKNATFKITPREILADDNMLDCFSKKDIRTITYLACNDSKPKSKIILQEFCEKLNKIIFGIKRPGEAAILKKTANEISLDKDLLRNLSPEEAHMVGYLVSDESHQDEKNTINSLK